LRRHWPACRSCVFEIVEGAAPIEDAVQISATKKATQKEQWLCARSDGRTLHAAPDEETNQNGDTQ